MRLQQLPSIGPAVQDWSPTHGRIRQEWIAVLRGVSSHRDFWQAMVNCEAPLEMSEAGMNEHIRKHHRVCLGLLAQIYHNNLSEHSQKIAIEQAICSAEGLGLNVSLARLIAGQPIATDGNASGDPALS